MLSVSLDCSFLIAPSVLSNVYLFSQQNKQTNKQMKNKKIPNNTNKKNHKIQKQM
jgi:hypothetical protein